MKKSKLNVASIILLASSIAGVIPIAFAENTTAATPDQFMIGAFPSHPKGPGPGKLAVVPVHEGATSVYTFGHAGTPSGNSFYIAEAGKHVFVSNVAGTTDVITIDSGKQVKQFHSISGGRVAAVSPDRKLVFVLSGKKLAAYATSDGAKRFEVAFGGNAMVFNVDGSRVYVGGNMDKTIAEIDASTGQILRHIAVGHSGDLAWAHGLVFSANMQSGVMSAFNPTTGKIYNMTTPEVDSKFSYHKIPAATAGFMQLAVSPDQKYVYAAGFSGHILRFSTQEPAYLDQVSVSVGKTGANKLSGLALLPDGLQAITTVENRHESVIVDLSNGHIVKHLPGVASNRWILAGHMTVH